MDFELYTAVVSDNNDVLMKEIEDRLSVEGLSSVIDQRTPTNLTVLHLASQHGKLNIVEGILLTHPSLLLKLNSRGETPLHLAARGGHYNVAKALITAAKSSIIVLNDIQTTPSTVVEFLIRKANVELETALHEAVRYNHLNVVDLLVKEDPSHAHPQNNVNETPLYLASVRGYEKIITTILDNCVSPTYDGPEGRTALHASVLDVNGDACTRLLLKKRKELIRAADDYGWTVFHYVAYMKYYQKITYLLDFDKSAAYIPDKNHKRIPLHVAVFKGSLPVMEKLLEYCPDSYDITDEGGRNILHIAAESNHTEIIKYILENKKEYKHLLSQKDKNGNTPLHSMSMVGCYISELMNQNYNQVDWDTLNGKNQTPLDILISNYEEDVDAPTDQRKMAEALLHTNAKTHCSSGPKMIDPAYENALTTFGNNTDKNKKELEADIKVRDTHMIVAALIATVALTAGFSMPGGFEGDAGPKQGSPVLLRKTAFRMFVVTDSIALLCSLSSLLIYFMTSCYRNYERVNIGIYSSSLLNLVSIIAMMLAFITGMFAVLAHSLALAITVSVISSLFFLLVYVLMKKLYSMTQYIFKLQNLKEREV